MGPDSKGGVGLEVFGNIFLGGVEARCRPYTQCKLKNECCGCQVNTQIAASPYKVIVGSDGSRVQCKPEVLPLCRVDQKTGKMEGLQGGRWVKNKCSKEDLTKPDHDCARFPFFEGEQDNAAGSNHINVDLKCIQQPRLEHACRRIG